MALIYTAETLLASIRTSGILGNVNSLGTDDLSMLKIINEEVRAKVVPQIMRVQQEYLVRSIRDSITANKTKMRIPLRAIGQQLRDLFYVDSGLNRHYLGSQPIPREELHNYNSTGSDVPSGWFFEGPYIRLVPTVGSYNGYIEYAIFMAPSLLVDDGETRIITAIDPATKTVTFATDVPTTWTAANLFDIHAPWEGAELKIFNAVASVVGGLGALSNKITFTTAIDGSTFGCEIPVAVGDYVCLAGQSAILQIPDDLIPFLIDDVVLKYAMAGGDTDGVQIGRARMKDQAADTLQVLENRIKSRPRKIRLEGSALWRGRFRH